MTDEFQNLFEDNFLEDIKATSTEKLKEGERRIVSILFADISGFTKLSEKMDHEEIRDIIDKLFKLFTSCVEKYGGYVDKYAGDEIMALFGAKVASEVDTHRSISCAISMLNTLDKFNSYIIKDPKFNIDESNKLSMRIGINTGMVTTGSVGKERTGDFTAYGKVVNLASRMESNAPINRIMVPENVMKQAQRDFSFNDHGMIEVKGFEDEISVYLVESAGEIDDISDSAPYIGNQSNLDLLMKMYNSSSRSLEEYNRSDLCTIGIRGEAGIGKSRLVSEFIRQVNQGITTNNIIRVAADSISVSPYQIFISIIKKSLSIERSDSQDVVLEKFSRGFKDISNILNGPLHDQFIKFKARIAYLLRLRITEETSGVSGQDLKDEIQLSMRVFIQAICARSNLSNVPFIVIIEDLQSIDIASLDVLNKIIDMESIGLSSSVQRNQALCFIFDYRDGYNIPDFIQQIDSFRELEINPLNRDECHDMIRRTMSEDIIPDEVVSVLMEHSNGNPFFIEEWLKSLGKELKWSINDINSWISSIPESMHSLILSGVDTLDEDSKQVLRCASVIGKRFYLDMIKQLEGKVENLSNVSKALEVLMKENFISQDIRNKGSYIFRHTLTQEVAYESILKSNKKILHGLLADIIESNYQDKKEELVEQLANHYEKSENISKAKLYLLKAAKKSQVLYNLRQANDLYKRVIAVHILSNENLRGILDGDIKNIDQDEAIDFIDILHNHANTLMLLGEMGECSKILFSIKSILDKNLNDKKLYSRILGTIGKMYWLMGSYDESENIFKEQLSLSQDSDQSDEKFDILLYIARIQRVRGNNKEALKQLDNLKDKIRDNSDLLSQVFGELGVAYKNEGDFDTALDYYQRQEEICIQNNKKNLLLTALGNIGVLYMLKKENQRALEIFDRMLMLNQEMGDKAVISRTHGNKGIIFISLKKYEDALRELNLQLKVSEYSRDSQGIEKANSNKGNVYMEMSEYDKATSCFNKALNISLEIGNKREEGISLANLGEICMKTGDTEKSREYLEKSLIIFRENGDINHEKMVMDDIKKLDNNRGV